MIYEALAKSLKTLSRVPCDLKHLPIIKIKLFWGELAFLQQHLTDLKMLVNVTFLPSINQAPTELSTIIEIVKQVKLKFQVLYLKEVDLVADHAIFSKFLQMITGSDPETSLLINLMGGFQIAWAFLAVIGKRFAESGFLWVSVLQRVQHNDGLYRTRSFHVYWVIFNNHLIFWDKTINVKMFLHVA